MFDEIRYELKGVENDRNRNVGIINIFKRLISLSFYGFMILKNAGWNLGLDIPEGHFNICMLLNILLDFCEDYKRIVVNDLPN